MHPIGWFQRLRAGLLLRTVARELRGIRAEMVRQNDLLERVLAIYLPDALPQAAASAPVADTGVSFLDVIDAGLAQEYAARTYTDTGRYPTDDEILIYLADEKTLNLQQRLKQRAALQDLADRGGG